jgi:hypothetical protein
MIVIYFKDKKDARKWKRKRKRVQLQRRKEEITTEDTPREE